MRDRTALAIPAAVGGLLGAVRMTSLDLPLMLACGDRLLAGHGIPRENPFHWPHPGFPWLDDKWGFGLLTSLAERAGGAFGLTVLNVLLGVAAGALLHALARRRNDPWTAAGLAAAGVTLLSYRSMLRAEWISFLGVAWTLLHVEGVLAGSWRRAALVVLAVPFWAACHVWWFLGPAVVGVAALRARSLRGGLVAAAALAAGAVSPYGLDNLAHPARILATSGQFGGTVSELSLPFSGPFTYFHVLAIAFAAQVVVWRVLRTDRRTVTKEDVLALVLLVLAFRYDRNLPFAGIALVVAAPALPAARRPVAAWRGWSAAPAALGLVLGIGWLAPERRFGSGWDDTVHSWRLVESLGPETARHRYVNDFSIGSFLDRARGSSFIDGNTHGWPAGHFALYRKALEGTVGVEEIDRRFPNDGWLLRTSAPHTRVLVVGLLLEGDYAPTDWDDLATLFRPVPDADRADGLWRRWLEESYLPRAREWFPSAAEIFADGRAPPAEDDVGGWRALVAASPWELSFLDALRRACDRRRDDVQAARVWRLARRVP